MGRVQQCLRPLETFRASVQQINTVATYLRTLKAIQVLLIVRCTIISGLVLARAAQMPSLGVSSLDLVRLWKHRWIFFYLLRR